MKTATAEEVPQQWTEILQWLAREEEVQIVKSGRVIATIVPPLQSEVPPDTADYVGRAQAIWGANPEGTPLSELVYGSRGGGA